MSSYSSDIIETFTDLLSGETSSKGLSITKDLIESIIKKKELKAIIDQYDQIFMKNHCDEIAKQNSEMELLTKNRNELIFTAKSYIRKNDTTITSSRKNQFIGSVCSKFDISLPFSKKYLSDLYDLVSHSILEDLPVEQRAAFNTLSDEIYEETRLLKGELKKQDSRLGRVENTIEELTINETKTIDFKSYYERIKNEFTEEKKGVYKNLVGNASDENSYIDAYITVNSNQVSVLSYLDKWFGNTNNRVVLIYGEPGHGKSLLCNKAVFEFREGRFLKNKANNVLAVSLNTSDNRKIINGREVELENALIWKADKKYKFKFSDCKKSLLFMDGFDEFIDEARRANTDIGNIYDFMDSVNGYASNNDMYIVVLSRTIAVSHSLGALSETYEYYELSPISKEQQDEWMEEHQEYSDYKEELNNIQKDLVMHDLLGVPLLFRLIVHNRFNIYSSNTVELYNNLFTHILKNKHITDDEELEQIEKGLSNLAYRIYCTDTHIAVLNKGEWDPNWIFAFYVRSSNKKKISFFHRTFYQYFLAKYIYSGILNVTDENVDELISSFAEREFDSTVRNYLSLMYNENDKKKVHANVKKMVDALNRTEGYFCVSSRVNTGNAEKSYILRSQNIYRNVFHIVAFTFYIIHFPIKGNLEVMLRRYRSNDIVLFSEDNKRADLKEACLAGAYMKNAFLSKANMTKTDFRGADLRGAKMMNSLLNKAVLIGANLKGAYLTDAKLIDSNLAGANLRSASLQKADFTGAQMRWSDLTGAIMTETVMTDAKMRGVNLERAYLEGTELSGAFLKGANLRGAIMNRTIMRGACLRGADLTGAIITGKILNDAELYETIIDAKYKEIIDSSTKGYESIIWVSFEKPPTDLALEEIRGIIS